MSLENKLLDDLKDAMKRKDELATSVLRMLKSQLMLEKTKKGGSKELSEETVQQVFARYAKKLADAVEQFEKGGRDDLVTRHKAELEVVQRYLPEAASQEEINQVIEEAITATEASGPSDMGRVMGQVMGKLRGRADGKALSQLVRQRLAGE
jgi:uncharacterized protein YqeY